MNNSSEPYTNILLISDSEQQPDPIDDRYKFFRFYLY